MEDKYKSLKAYWSNSKVAEREASYHPFGKTDKNTAVAGVLNVDLSEKLEITLKLKTKNFCFIRQIA